MVFVRSLLFNAFLYVFTIVCLLIASAVSLFLPSRLPQFACTWARAWLKVYQKICGVTYEVKGAEYLPQGGYIIAMKHQSTWDTFALFAIFPRPVYVLKHELMLIPLFGWTLRRLGCIPVKRGAGRAALDGMIAGARSACASGRQVVIFPEGTRSTAGQPGVYKTGVSYLYQELHVPCVPVALNSGLLWPRRKFLRPPGVITVEILPAIAPGLERKQMFSQATQRIEATSQRLSGEVG